MSSISDSPQPVTAAESARRWARPLGRGAASLQLVLGVLGVVLVPVTVALLRQSAGDGGPQNQGAQLMFLLSLPGLGVPLLVLWVQGRRRRRPLVALAVVAAVIAAASGLGWALAWRGADVARDGLWWGLALAGLLLAVWLLVALAGVLELRWRRRRPDDSPLGWRDAATVLLPTAVVVLMTVLVVQVGPGSMLRLNTALTPVGEPEPPTASSLSGGQRWELDLAAGGDALPTTGGLAVPVAGDSERSAGVVMVQPGTGEIRWRHELRGAREAPELAASDTGRALVVSFDARGMAEDVSREDTVLAADTGRVLATWPQDLVATDPPVRFSKVARGTNTVRALSPTGSTLWRYRPDGCDPRSAASTPDVVLVVRRVCEDVRSPGRATELVGLDPGSGEERWRSPQEDGSESAPEQLLVRPGFQLELDEGMLQRRRLDTGAVEWSAQPPTSCSSGRLLTSASEDVVYLAGCLGGGQPGARTVALDTETGEPLWRPDVEGDLTSLVAVDRDRLLALTALDGVCAVQLLRADGSEPLLPLPEAGRAEPYPVPAEDEEVTRCPAASLLRVGESYVLELVDVRAGSDRLEGRRYLGLS